MNALTGATSEVAGSPFTSPDNQRGVVVDPTGAFIYSSGISTKVIGLELSTLSGTLSPVPDSPKDITGDVYVLDAR